MFRCQICEKVSPANMPQNKVVLQSREKEYVNPVPDTKNETLTTYGQEIVKEVNACNPCAQKASVVL